MRLLSINLRTNKYKMTTPENREVWQCGSIENIPDLLQPIAHALLQARNEMVEMVTNFSVRLLWQKLASTATAAFHLQHLTGVLDRVFTYTRDNILSKTQLHFLAQEGKEDVLITATALLHNFETQIAIALIQLSITDIATVTEVRYIGCKKIPTTVIGLLFHAAEHTMRHTGQLYVTIKMLKNNIAT